MCRRLPTLLAIGLIVGPSAHACQWCLTNGVKATVTATEVDAGGTFFDQRPDPARTRHYFVAAESEAWFYAPLRHDPTSSLPPSPALAQQVPVLKRRFVAYTDGTFSTRALPTGRLGILGPVFRGVIGDYLAVTLWNRTDHPVSLHPHGVRYDKDSEGAYYLPKPGRGAALAPGAKFTYVWHLDAAAGPRADEPSSKAWLYHSHVHSEGDMADGLVGFILVTDPMRARADGTPRDVDREEAALFLNFPLSSADDEADEEATGSIEGLEPPPTEPGPAVRNKSTTPAAVRGRASRHEIEGWPTINGRAFANLGGLEMNEGERVRWYLFGLGAEQDVHSAHWHGLRVLEDGRRGTDVVELIPGSMKVADAVAENPGTWLFHCHVTDHMMNGMYAHFVVHPRTAPLAATVPGESFLGLPGRAESLRLLRTKRLTNGWQFEGVISAERKTRLSQVRVQVVVAGHEIVLPAFAAAQSATEHERLEIRNARLGDFLTDGFADFRLSLIGPAWSKLERFEPADSLRIQFGQIRHEVPLSGSR